MFCKNCGKQITSRDNICHSCGTPQPNSLGGNGFWDILSSNEDNAQSHYSKIDDVADVGKRDPIWLKWAIILLCSLAILCSILATAAVLFVKRDMENYTRKIDAFSHSLSETDSSLRRLEENVVRLQETVNGLTPEEDCVDTANADNNESSDGRVIITKQPSDERIPVGGSGIAFKIIVSGNDYVFQWQKEVQGAWHDIGNAQGCNSQIEYDSATNATENRLEIINATNDLSGIYRCKVSNTNNDTVYTTSVSLSIYQLPTPAIPTDKTIPPDDNWGLNPSDVASSSTSEKGSEAENE